MEYIKSMTVADVNDRMRISSLIKEDGNHTMPSLVILGSDFQAELFYADNENWIKNTLLNQLILKGYYDEDVIFCRKILKEQGLKRKDLIKLIQEAIKMRML
jgi:hypothetical protein